MANAKEIQNRIKSIQDTRKITSAMYMMSSMKLRKARQRLDNTEPFFDSLQEQIEKILYHFPDMEHRYFDNRNEDISVTEKKKGYVIITGDKGMAGAYNHNVLKEAEKMVDDSEHSTLYVVGELGRHHFKKFGYPVNEDFHYSANNPTMHRARIMTEHLVEMYRDGDLDEIDIIYTRLQGGAKEEVKSARLLPLQTHTFIKQEKLEKAREEQAGYDASLDTEFALIYPSPEKVLDRLAKNYVTGFVYGALVESFASEENARMLAMQSATDNADAMLHDLSIEFNRVRQAAITQEITEVIGGAKALKKKKKKQAR